MSELEAATGEKKGGGDVSGVRDIFCFLRMIIDTDFVFFVSCAFFIGNCTSLRSSYHDAQNLL